MRKKQIQYAEAEITGFSKKGNGIGLFKRESGTISEIDVSFTMPGDTVRASITRKKTGLFKGKLEEVIKPSENRIPPRCIHFATCGGCRLQHVPYDLQLKAKNALVTKYFEGLVNEDVTFHPIIQAPNPWHYRNKMEFTFSSDASNNKYLGLIMDGGRGKVLNLTECHLTNPWFIDALKAVNGWWHSSNLDAYHMMRNTGSLRTLTVREGQLTGDRLVMLTVSGNPDFALHKSQLDSFVKALKETIEPVSKESTLSIFLRIQQIAKGQETEYFEMHLHGRDHILEKLNIKLDSTGTETQMTFSISPTAFFQPNSLQAGVLYSKALELGKLAKNDVVYDLYCGTGTLGICIAKHVKTVVGVEISAESSLDARTNAKHNNLENYTVYTGNVSEILKEKVLPKPDVLMLDPPRSGLDAAALKQILALNASKIVYISCNPETQAQNIRELVSAGYSLKVLQPVDQFPQTMHIENIALLTR